MANQQEVAKTDSSTESKIVPSNSPFQRSYWCQTKAELIRINFDWTIERLAFFVEGNIWETFTSTEFESKFSLRLIVQKHYIQIYLLSSTVFEYPLRVEIVVKAENLSENICKSTIFIPVNDSFPVHLCTIYTKDLLKLENFVRGKMAISCKIESLNRKQLTGNAIATEKYLDETVISDQEKDRIPHQLEEMFEKMTLTDVNFDIRGRKIAAHKNILAMRSPVFAAMFQHPTKEMQSNKVEVKDIDPDVFQEVLRFIYTGKTQPTAMNKMAPNLLAAADKYLLEDLKIQCETHLIRQMSAENCLELLSLTTHHPAEHLKKNAIEYFRRYPSKPIELFFYIGFDY
jgi:speckle-type POZ protein